MFKRNLFTSLNPKHNQYIHLNWILRRYEQYWLPNQAGGNYCKIYFLETHSSKSTFYNNIHLLVQKLVSMQLLSRSGNSVPIYFKNYAIEIIQSFDYFDLHGCKFLSFELCLKVSQVATPEVHIFALNLIKYISHPNILTQLLSMRNLKFLAVINFYIYVNMYLGLIKDM